MNVEVADGGQGFVAQTSGIGLAESGLSEDSQESGEVEANN